MADWVAMLQEGLRWQSQGKNREAAAIYQQVLEIVPDQPDAIHLLGLTLLAEKKFPQAIGLIQRATQLSPSSAVFWGNLGVAYRQAEDYGNAIVAYRKGISLDPQNAETWFNLGKSLRLIGESEEATKAFETSVKLKPNYLSPYLSLINDLVTKHELDAALQLAEHANRRCGGSGDLLLSKGAIFKKMRRMEEALKCYEQAVEFDPRNVDAMTRIAAIHISAHRFREAEEWIARAAPIPRDRHLVSNVRGVLLNTLGDATAAVKEFENSIQVTATHATTFANYSSSLKKLGKLSSALTAIQEARRLEPKNTEMIVLEGGLHLTLGGIGDAQSCFESALKERGDYEDAYHSLMMSYQYMSGVTPGQLAFQHARYEKHCLPPVDGRYSERSEPKEGPLHVGFVSGDLGAHPVGYFAYRLFESIDPEKFRFFVYSDRLGRDWLSEWIEKKCHAWHDSIAWSDDQLGAQIQKDQIDILFDLAGHTAHNRLSLFARRAAPCQITWCGYVGTTGVPAMDYLLADRYHIPEGAERFYHERVLRMPDGYVTYQPPLDLPEVSDLPILSKGHMTLAAMCNPAKVNPQVLRLWGRILKELPESRLLLCYNGWGDELNQRRVREVFAEYNVSDRVDFDQVTGANLLMAKYGEVDLALDTFPYSGGLTTIEALWMGVPTVTWPHATFAGRHSFSHLSNVGLTDFVTNSEEEYFAKVIALSRDVDSLARLRKRLRGMVESSPLCDGPKFARAFEKILTDVQQA